MNLFDWLLKQDPENKDIQRLCEGEQFRIEKVAYNLFHFIVGERCNQGKVVIRCGFDSKAIPYLDALCLSQNGQN
jgi:hypothetical protein